MSLVDNNYAHRFILNAIDRSSIGKICAGCELDEDRGLAEPLPYPFMAVVGQAEMKTALLLTMINPAVSGVLLIGPRGTGKTTAVRSISDLPAFGAAITVPVWVLARRH